jgi:hypothetical protein
MESMPGSEHESGISMSCLLQHGFMNRMLMASKQNFRSMSFTVGLRLLIADVGRKSARLSLSVASASS